MDTFRKILGTHFHVLKNEDMKNLDFILQLQLKQSLALGVVRLRMVWLKTNILCH